MQRQQQRQQQPNISFKKIVLFVKLEYLEVWTTRLFNRTQCLQIPDVDSGCLLVPVWTRGDETTFAGVVI